MADREMVIKGIECLTADEITCNTDCPYFSGVGCVNAILRETLELLKGQEPVKVIIHDEDEWYGFYAQCPECTCEWMMDHEKLKYCPHCGKRVKWE